MDIRDLVHGFIHLTSTEVDIINHVLFQRLRNIRQNDVGCYVYPSLNTSRFEHSIGCAHIAGKMAENLSRSKEWNDYLTATALSKEEFIQVCRVYALLHDIGHLPLSHLFEIAFDDYVDRKYSGKRAADVVHDWFGGNGFEKPHEACGSVLVKKIISDVKMNDKVQESVLVLMGNKLISPRHPLKPIKLLIDSEIDADRIDAAARDGVLAGGEYGTFDIERICSSVFVQRHILGWRIVYSHKALSSLEGLLLDRYRTHTWVHFHHRVVALKVALSHLIGRLLCDEIITRAAFSVDAPETFALRDDLWLWSLIRERIGKEDLDDLERSAIRIALYRDKLTTLLWKNRTSYQLVRDQIKELAGVRSVKNPNRKYEKWISASLGVNTCVFCLPFKPVDDAITPIADHEGVENLGSLWDVSPLAQSLTKMWEEEPQYYIVMLGKSFKGTDFDDIRKKWVERTAEWILHVHAEH